MDIRSHEHLTPSRSSGERRNGTADTSTLALCSPRTGARTRARTLFDALARLALQRRLAAASHSGKRAHASGENVLRGAVGSARISGPVFGTGGLASSPPGRVGLGSGLAEGSVRARPGLAVEVETAENRHVNKLYPCPCPHPEPEPEPEPQKQDRSEVAASTRQPPWQQRTARRTARWRAVRRALKKNPFSRRAPKRHGRHIDPGLM